MRDDGQADRYTNLKVRYVDHHNPDLILFDKASKETHRIDLTRLSSRESLHKLMVLLGLKEKCGDQNGGCPDWAKQGECANNPEFMGVKCRKYCNLCSEGARVVHEVPCKDTAEARVAAAVALAGRRGRARGQSAGATPR